MKRVFALTAASLAALAGVATTVSAATDSTTARIERAAPNLDVSAMSETEIRRLLSIIAASDHGDVTPRVQAYLHETETHFGTDASVYPFPVSEH